MTTRTDELPKAGPLLLLTNADRALLTDAAERMRNDHPEVAEQVHSAAQDAESLLALLTGLQTALLANQTAGALSQLEAVLGPITALNDNEARLRAGIAGLGGSWNKLTAIISVDQLPLSLLTDAALLHQLAEVATELSDYANEVGLRAAERARQIERRSGAVED